MRIQVLGPIRAWHDGEPIDLGPTRQRALLGLLALACNQPIPRAELVDTLWGERPPSTAVNVIQTHVKHLRRLLEPDRRPYGRSAVLPTVGDGYALHVSPEDLDLLRFRRLVAEAGVAQRDGELDRAAALLRDALRLWQSAPLVDIPFLAAHPKLVALSAERLAAQTRYGDVLVATGAADEAVPMLEDVARAQPLDESLQARLIRAYHAAGRRVQAFTAYHGARRRLAEELGVDPGPELTEAHLLLLKDDKPKEDKPTHEKPKDGRHSVPSQLPADVHGFTGRGAELAALDGLLPGEAATAVSILVLAGTAGVGKTALAVRWAHRVRHRFPDGQLYADLRGYDPEQPASTRDVLARFLHALGVDDQDIPPDPEGRADRYRTELTGRRMLVVLDNAATVEQVRPLLPGTPACVVLVTSRDSLPGLVARHGARRLDLDLLPVDDAVTLLGTLIGERVRDEPEAARTLAAQCVRLPLALRVAAELATSRSGTPLGELVAELSDQRRRLDLLEAGGDPRAAVRAVFSWSYRHLPPEAADAFRLLGTHPGPHLDAPAVAALADTTVPQARRVLDQLARAHLVQPTRGGRYGMHDLLRAYSIYLAESGGDELGRRAALTRLFDHYLTTATAAAATLHPAERQPAAAHLFDGVPDARAWLDAERATLVEVCGYAAAHGWPGHTIRLAAALFRYLDGGHFADALTVHNHARAAARQLGDRAAEANAITDLGSVYWRLGRYAEAAEHHEQALAVHRRLGDLDGAARTLSNLGNVCWRQGRHEAAAGYHQQALELFRRLGDDGGEARALTNLANVYRLLGRDDAAVEHHQQALTLYRRLGDRSGEAHVLTNLGNVHRRGGRLELAGEHLRQALALFRDLGHRYGEAHALNGLGAVEVRQGRHRAAADHHAQALEIFRRIGERYGEAAALNGLGVALRGLGRLADALKQHTAALSVALASGDRDEQAEAHAGLAATHEATGNPPPP